MLVNIFDSNWSATQSCSVYNQESAYIDYVHKQRQFDGVTIFTDEWINNPVVDFVKSKYKIGWLREPYCLHPQTYERAQTNRDKFDFILTYDADLLRDIPEKFRFCPYAGTWLSSIDWGIKPKSKLCSMLIGSKLSTDGHRIRHEIADLIQDEKYSVDFYGALGTSVNYSSETKLQVLEDYCFSIVTETCYEENLFTEWLLDCFAVGTIPIYWGCPNLGEFFEAKGVLQFDTLYRLEKILAGLSMSSWVNQLNAVYSNLLKMREYAVTDDWLFLNILKELK